MPSSCLPDRSSLRSNGSASTVLMHSTGALLRPLFPVRISQQKVPCAVVLDIFISSVWEVIYYQAEEDKRLFDLSNLKILIHFFLGSAIPFEWSDTSCQHKTTLASHQTLLSRLYIYICIHMYIYIIIHIYI